MTSLEQHVREALADRSSAMAEPPVDLADIVAGGRAARRRRDVRRTVGLVAATALLAVVASTVYDAADLPSGGGPATEQPARHPVQGFTLDQLPSGDLPSVPFCASGRRVLGGGLDLLSPYGCTTVRHRGRSSLVSIGWSVLAIVDDQVVLLDDDAGLIPRLSHDGRFAVWETGARTLPAVVVYDMEAGAELGRLALGDGTTGAVKGVDTQGRAFLSLASGTVWMFDPGQDRERLVRVTGLPEHSSFVTDVPGGVGLVVREGPDIDGPAQSVYGAVDAAGRFVRAGQPWPVGGVTFSPDGDLFVQESNGTYWVREAVSPLPDGGVRLRIPEWGRPAADVVWESSDAVLLSFWPTETDQILPEKVQAVLRCSVESGGCEIAAGLELGAGDPGSPYSPALS